MERNADKKPVEKYKNAILYFATYLNHFQLGSTKLAKLLYYLDFISYRDRKETVTGTHYYKQSFGPLAEDFNEVIGQLVEEKKLVVETVNLPDGRETNNYEALKPAKEEIFEEYELILLRKLVNEYRDWNTDQIVAKSHLEAPWVKSTEGSLIDFKLAYDIEDFNQNLQKEYDEEDNRLFNAIEIELAGAK